VINEEKSLLDETGFPFRDEQIRRCGGGGGGRVGRRK